MLTKSEKFELEILQSRQASRVLPISTEQYDRIEELLEKALNHIPSPHINTDPYDEIFNKAAKKHMKRWDLTNFKLTHPHLYKAIILAMKNSKKLK